MSESSENGSPVGPGISWPIGRPPDSNQKQNLSVGVPPPPQAQVEAEADPAYLPGGKKSLSGISIRAFGLGIVLGISIVATVQLAYIGFSLWRAAFFIATLTLFHYLEFDSTARFNPPDAKISSFLLSANGSAYNVAHAGALTEFLIRHWLQSNFKPAWLRIPFQMPHVFPSIPVAVPIGLGITLVIIGQYVRTAAMAEAGQSFNHIVQSTKKADHVLVTTGIYSFSRHPSYFGFFWWGLGTQLVLGNYICFPAYAVVLWNFFQTRITKEEQFLVLFFGQDYLTFRDTTPVLIPFIR